MVRRVLAAVASAALIASVATAVPASSAPSTMTVESQAWWAKDGLVVPGNVGHHVHVEVTVPKTGQVIDGLVNVPAKVTFHKQVGRSNFIRWQDGSTTKGQIALVAGACDTCSVNVNLPIDFSKFGTGLRELRISVNVPDEQPDGLPGSDPGDQRMYQSFGIEECVRACSPIEQGGRSLNFVEARGWYQDHEYQNARVTSGIDSVRAGGTVSVKLAPGSGGKATKFSGAYIDPKMHDADAGLVLKEVSGPYSGSIVIPANLAPGVHRLVLVASDGQNAGVLGIPFVVGGDPVPSSSPSPSPTPVLTPSPSPTPEPTPLPSLSPSPSAIVCGI